EVCIKEGKPLIFVAHSFSQEFVNVMKKNVLANRNRGGMNAAQPELNIALTKFNKDRGQEYEDLAAFLNADLLTKEWDNPDEFYERANELIEKDFNLFKYNYLGSAETVNMDSTGTQYVRGAGNGGKKVKSRIALIDREIEYTKTLAGKKNIDMDLYRLEKRKDNLLAKVARLFVGGSSEADMTARNFLIEDSIFACKSALKHGYISGGNLAIA